MQEDLTPSSIPPVHPDGQVPQAKKISKALIIGVLLGFVVLLTVIAVLVIAVLQKGAANTTTVTTGESDQAIQDKKVIATVATKNENITFQLYTPRQTANNTTIDFALKNTCETNCPAKSYALEPYHSSHTGSNMNNMYLVDDAGTEKYNVVTDTSDKTLVSPQCYGYLNPGQKIECFVSFAKVPSGTTVSLVMRDYRIDNINIP